MEYFFRFSPEILAKIEKKKSELDAFQPLPPNLEKKIEDWERIEVTYSDNCLSSSDSDRLMKDDIQKIVRGCSFNPSKKEAFQLNENYSNT